MLTLRAIRHSLHIYTIHINVLYKICPFQVLHQMLIFVDMKYSLHSVQVCGGGIKAVERSLQSMKISSQGQSDCSIT